MWLLFRADGFGTAPKEFARLLTLFACHDQKLNAAALPEHLTEEGIRASIPYSYQAAPFLQIVTNGTNPGSFSLEQAKAALEAERIALAERFENYYACFVPREEKIENACLGLLPECGYRMLSRNEESRKGQAPLPEFSVNLRFREWRMSGRSGRELFREVARYFEAGREFTGIALEHASMNDEDFAALDELLKEMSKRCVQSVFFSDLLPGSERRLGAELAHL